MSEQGVHRWTQVGLGTLPADKSPIVKRLVISDAIWYPEKIQEALYLSSFI